MDKLMKQALDKHKIVRYIPTFLEVMKTYKSLLEAENQSLNQPPSISKDCEHNPIEKGQFYECSKCGEIL